MNKDFQLANNAYAVETAILSISNNNDVDISIVETESNISITNKDEATKLGVSLMMV